MNLDENILPILPDNSLEWLKRGKDISKGLFFRDFFALEMFSLKERRYVHNFVKRPTYLK